MQPNPALEQFIRSIPLFSLVEPAEMMDILRLLQPLELEQSEVLFREGDPGDAMWVLGQGTEVAVSATPPGGGRPVVVARPKTGETLGEMALVDNGGRSGTAVVTHAGPAHRINAVEFQALRDAYKPAAFKVLRKICMLLCQRLRATSDRIVPSGGPVPPAPPLTGRPLEDPALLDEFGPFHRLPQVVKLALAQKLTLVETEGVQPIFGEGADADAAYFVLSGEVKVGRHGKTLATLGPGTMFGLVAAIDEGKRSANCVTTMPTRLLRLADGDFDHLFEKGNRFAFHIVDLVARQLVQHLREANAVLVSQGGLPVTPAAGKPAVVRMTPPTPEFTPQQGAGSLGDVFGGEAVPLELDLELTL